jgi:hypothetical protein
MLVNTYMDVGGRATQEAKAETSIQFEIALLGLLLMKPFYNLVSICIWWKYRIKNVLYLFILTYQS